MAPLFSHTLKKLESKSVDTIEFVISENFYNFIKEKDDDMWKNIESRKQINLYKYNKDMNKGDFIKKMTNYSIEFNLSQDDEYHIVDNRYCNINTIPNFKYRNIKYDIPEDFIFNFYISRQLIAYFKKNSLPKFEDLEDLTIKVSGSWYINFFYDDKLYLGYKNICDKKLTKEDIVIKDCKNYTNVDYKLCEKFRDIMLKLVETYNSNNEKIDLSEYESNN